MRYVLALILIAGLLVACGSSTTQVLTAAMPTSEPTVTHTSTQIAFVSGGHIYVVDVGSGNVQQLTDGPRWNSSPAWSPDGTQIAFMHTPRGNISTEWWVAPHYRFTPTPMIGHQMPAPPPTLPPPTRTPDPTPTRTPTPPIPLRYEVQPGDTLSAIATRYGMTVDDLVRVNRLVNADGLQVGQNLTIPTQPPITRPPITRPPITQPPTPLPTPIPIRTPTASNPHIYVMDADGGNVQQLTDGPGWDVDPAWSPDGTRIAFRSNRDGGYGIYVMDADGGNVRQLTNTPGWAGSPAWSLDGSRIAFQSDRAIYVMDADGRNVRLLTDGLEVDWEVDWNPTWSPDGTRIAFVGNRDRGYGIYVVDADGGKVQQLAGTETVIPTADKAPAWSPDGSQIAFQSDRDGDGDIYVMDADGENVRQLTDGGNWSPQWSPDGSRIVFTSNRDGCCYIYVMDADGGNVRQLTDTPGLNSHPAWSPVR